MDITVFRVLATVLSFVTFGAIVWWAYSRRNSRRFDEAAQLPFIHAEDAPATTVEHEEPK